MKKIVPFNNVLNFETDVCEITAISLEHKIDMEDDAISGVFYITGEYKITDGQLEREKFNFELPFDIALGNTYDRSTLVVDIDDFRYEIVDRNKLKVNIDLYIDGEVVPDRIIEEDRVDNNNLEEEVDTNKEVDTDKEVDTSKKVDEIEPVITSSKERIDLLDEMLDNSEEKDMESEKEININNENNNNQENINILNGISNDTEYVTYRVYRIMEGDTIDKIIEKYKVSREELEKYNDLGDIKIGDKLIIPANDK